MINRSHTCRAGKIYVHASAGSDLGSDYLSFAVHYMTAAIKDVSGQIRIVVDNESFGRLITCRLAILNLHDSRTGYRYSLD